MEPSNDLEKVSAPLERAFFGGANVPLLAELKLRSETERQMDLLREVVKIRDETFLKRLTALSVRPEIAVAVTLVPLVLVAWADGELHDRERRAVLEAARQRGVAAERIAGRLLDNALAQKPDPRLFEVWKAYVRRLWTCFTPDECWQMRTNLLQSAREVAEAAGGLLGLSKISAAERRVLDEIGAILD